MNTKRRSHKLLAVAAASALVFAACGDDDDGGGSSGTEAPAGTDAPTGTDAPAATEAPSATDGEPEPEPEPEPAAGGEGGTLIWAHEQEPPDLHLDDPENNLSIASWMIQSMIEGLYGVSAATEFIPELLAADAVAADNGDGTVTVDYTLRDGLTWSDGTPLTANDVAFTFATFMADDGTTDEDGNPNYVYLLGDRTGYDTIIDVTVVSDTEVSVTWSEFFAGWKSLFNRVYPAHVFDADPVVAAAEMNDALRDWATADGNVIPSSGPMIFDSWEKGVQMNFVRHDGYHGSVSPDVANQGAPASVAGVQINFVTDTDAQVNALLAQEAQIVFTQPQLAFEDLSSNEDFTVNASPGPIFEHWGLNLNNVHLAKPGVREALAFAMDKSEVMAGLYTPLFGDALPAEGLGNTYWMSNQPTYVNHAGDAGYGAGDIASAQASLEAAGYVLDGDVYAHPDDGALSLRVGTTGGNRLREIQQELIQAQMADAGIDIVIDNVEGGAYFGEVPFSADAIACSTSGGAEGNCDIWDITQFAWVGGPWPGGQSASYRTGSGNNPYGYANADWDAASDECDATVDDAARADCYNVLNSWVTTLDGDPETGLFMLPLTQKPDFFGCTSQLSVCAVSPDANDAGPLVNVVDYVFAE